MERPPEGRDELQAAHWLVERYGISVAHDLDPDGQTDGQWRATRAGVTGYATSDTWIGAVLAYADAVFRGAVR